VRPCDHSAAAAIGLTSGLTDETMQSITRSTPACHYNAVHAAEIREALAVLISGLIVPPHLGLHLGQSGVAWGSWFDCESWDQRDEPKLAGRINAFLHSAHTVALYSPCCEVSATMLLVRIHNSNSFAITGANWRAMMFVAIMISQKLGDDCSLPNGEFVDLWDRLLDNPDVVISLTLPELNRMEMQLCELLHWDIGLSCDTFWATISALAPVVDSLRDASNADPNDNDTMPVAVVASPTTCDALELPWGDKQCLLPDISQTSQRTTGSARPGWE
jgi:hypothetical protein